LKHFGEKVFKKVPINIVSKFEDITRWYGRVRKMVVQVDVNLPMIT
jgi:hypothetical protein